ncbi:MAG: hypothetical protein JWN03_1158 [Nocardia sp.]|uniref:hypothetical protein n=1 Tax=Nocardia sp. TaxID=1821 RepID=UPI0026319E5F|nr:hypothetical protein [Nocardia sp.]MCU1640883.1 hypothetical protein [Nocardia sp.]
MSETAEVIADLCDRVHTLYAELDIAHAKAAAESGAVLDFADELAAADNTEFSPAVAAGRLRCLVRGQW